MKMLILAASLAIAAVTSSVGAAQAQSLVITGDDDGGGYHQRHDRDRHWDRDSQWDRDRDRDWRRPHGHQVRCVTKTEEFHRHGRTVVKNTRMCR
jgi:Ni/Co efflux regulator RcnB